MESQGFTCPNPVCGRVFSNPVRAENLGSKNAEVYDACPYCLTEIVVEEAHHTLEKEEDLREKETEPVERLEMPAVKLESAKPESPVQGCQRHFGYLGERSSKEKIPDECMTCENIVKCMLKNIAS